MKPVKVLMLLENNPYPQDIRVRREATTLVSAGYQVTVICPMAKGQPFHQHIFGVHIYRFPAPPPGSGLIGYATEYGWSMLAMLVLSVYILARRGFDVIHAHNPPDTLMLIAVLYKVIGKMFVFDHHDLAPEMYDARFDGRGSKRVRDMLRLFERLSCRVADHVIATNQSYRLIEIERDGVPEERITIVRNGPEISRSQAVDPDHSITQPGKLNIGYVGVMGFQDGVDYLLRALHYLVYEAGRKDVYCVLMGKGDALDHLQELAQESGLADYVCFTGWVDHGRIGGYLAAMDLCVAPEPSNAYNDHSTMIKLTEYMAAGKPIVAFDLPEHHFTAQNAALYAPNNDPVELAKLILVLADDPRKRDSLGRIGRQRIETQLAWSYQADNLLKVYESLSIALAQRQSVFSRGSSL